jgi:hypothetical protein
MTQLWDEPQHPPVFIHWMMIPACYESSAVDEPQLGFKYLVSHFGTPIL